MGRRGKWLVVGGVAAGATAVTLFALNWYDTRVKWPSRIQRELLGREIASYKSLTGFEGFSHYGQGAFTWSYEVTLPDAAAATFCAGSSPATCHFQRTGRPERNVETSVVYDGGRLTIEEAWL